MFWHFLVLCKPAHARQPLIQAGFGLVELMVSISIMLIVMSVILVNQSSFNGAVLLRGQAYEIALATREIQLSAVSAMGDGGGTNASFRQVLGLHFDTANPDEYKIFKDSSGGNHFYDSNEDYGTQGKIDPRFEIESIKSGGSTMTDLAGGKVSVVFERPNFDARFFKGTGASDEVTDPKIEITIRKKGSTGTGPGDVRTVEITSSGQISVK
jgi:prepilin-type N-terminal cleavage/methylation domain-containing protein